MSLPSSPRDPGWQATRVPKLAYRKAAPKEEVDQVRNEVREIAIRASDASRTESARSSATRSATPAGSSAPTKKKNSVLSGLFTKEPTIMALAQVEADLKAKHGAATPQAVPHVSARKLPDHVPKVNSKWDGVPEVVKQREREEKQRRRTSQQSYSHSANGSARNSTSEQRNHPRRESDAVSGMESWRSPNGTINQCYPPSLYSTSSEDSQEVRGLRSAPSVRSHSLRSPFGSSLPEITAFFPHHKQQPTFTVPQRWQSVTSTATTSTLSSDQSRSDYSQREYYGSTIQAIPEHSSSPITTPREMSPVTPSYVSDRAVSPMQSLPKTDISSTNLATRSKRIVPSQIDAFLAGEARPLELNEDDECKGGNTDLPLRRYQQLLVDRVEPDVAKRPDSSRARLGLRATMVMRTEAAPWEAQDPPTAAPSSPGPAQKGRLPKALALFK